MPSIFILTGIVFNLHIFLEKVKGKPEKGANLKEAHVYNFALQREIQEQIKKIKLKKSNRLLSEIKDSPL